MVSVGLLGCGRIGSVHARSLSRLEGKACLAAVADAVPAAVESLAAEHGAKALAVEEIFEADDIDAVVVCTPTDTHGKYIQMAARAGKAIFCEKPVDATAEGAQACSRAVEEAGVGFMVGFQRRYDPNFAQIHARIQEGEIGAVETVLILSRDPEPPTLDYIRRSGGLYQDMMVHDFDMARFLLGEEPVSVYAAGCALVDEKIGEAGDVDTAAVTLTTGSGRICQILCSRRSAYGYDQRVEVHGEKGLLRADNQLENTVEAAGQTGHRRASVQGFFIKRYEAAYQAEMEAFVLSVEEGRQPEPGMVDGLRAQLLAEAATEAWRRGQPMALDIT